MRRLFCVLALCLALACTHAAPVVSWDAPEVDLEAQSAVFPLPELPAGYVIDHAVLVRDGEELGLLNDHVNLGKLTTDTDVWVRVYLTDGIALDGPKLTLHIGGGRDA